MMKKIILFALLCMTAHASNKFRLVIDNETTGDVYLHEAKNPVVYKTDDGRTFRFNENSTQQTKIKPRAITTMTYHASRVELVKLSNSLGDCKTVGFNFPVQLKKDETMVMHVNPWGKSGCQVKATQVAGID